MRLETGASETVKKDMITFGGRALVRCIGNCTFGRIWSSILVASMIGKAFLEISDNGDIAVPYNRKKRIFGVRSQEPLCHCRVKAPDQVAVGPYGKNLLLSG